MPRAKDENAQIPAAVTAAGKRADEIHKQIYPQPAAEPEKKPEAVAEKPAEKPAEAAPPAEKPAEPAAPEESWEHKYKSIKGRFDRVQPQLQAQAEQIANLQQVIAGMQKAPPVPAAAPSPADLGMDEQPLHTAAERENFGDEFLDVVGKKAKEQFSPEVKHLKTQLAALQQKLDAVTGTIVQDARAKLIATMDEKCPSWRELNNDENFLAWLRLQDPFSGAIRHELLKAAFEQNNAPRVLAFFNGFLSEEAATAPAPAAEPDLPEAPASKVSLEALAAPGRAKTAANPPAEKPVFNRAQIAAFYADKSAGRYRGREAEAAAFEKQIFEAQKEGRIR